MNPERAVEILENLVDGIHPLTGEILPEDNICEETGIAEALNYAIQVLNMRIEADRAIARYLNDQSKKAKTEADGRRLPENAGKPWTPEEDSNLLRLYRAGTSISAIARQYKRTKGAIRARLVRHGLAQNKRDIPEVDDGAGRIDNDDLSYRLLHGETIPELARRYGRTEKAIRARLFYLGFGGRGPNVLPGWRDDD